MTELYISEDGPKTENGASETHFKEYLEDTETNEMVGHELENMDALKTKKNIGRHTLLYQDKKGNIRLTLGPHWYMFIVGWSLLIGLGSYTVYNYWDVISTFKKCALVFLIIAEASLYMTTALLNPGIKARRFPKFGRSVLYCQDCLTTKEDKVIHCPDCDVCIQGHDHHCIWTGKCIGRGNFVPFILFVVCTPCYLVNLFMIFGEHS